ncbi:hypothetical protein N7534_000456 [Penicillium rubens]|nr:hypothetical protein N7534_000456 [Penicillium rubens]
MKLHMLMHHTVTGMTRNPRKAQFGSSGALQYADRPARDAQWLIKIATALNLLGAGELIVILTDNINTQLLMGKRSCKNSTR